MFCLLITTSCELTFLVFQFAQLMKNGTTKYCKNGAVPTSSGLSCNGAIAIMVVINWFFGILYLYWTACAYEHWCIGSKDAQIVMNDEKLRLFQKGEKIMDDVGKAVPYTLMEDKETELEKLKK